MSVKISTLEERIGSGIRQDHEDMSVKISIPEIIVLDVFNIFCDCFRLTKGTDITEAFHSMHVFGVDSKLLRKYFVKKASTPRNYRFKLSSDNQRARLELCKTVSSPLDD